MPFLTDEQSVKDGAPREVFDFAIGATHYRHTSAETPEEFGGNTYMPAPISRSALALIGAGDEPELVIEMDISVDVAQLILPGLPPQGLTVTFVRIQPNGSIQMRSGKVTQSRTSGRRMTLRVPAKTDDAFRTNLPGPVMGRRCNHILFDAEVGGGCAALRADHDLSPTVQSVSGRVITFTGSIGDAGIYKGGEAVFGTERRTIVESTTTTITVYQEFRTTPSGSMTIYRGCDYTLLTCDTVFDQAENFGGHAYMATRNPFEDRNGWE